MTRQPATQTHQQKPAATFTAAGLLQRKCACGNHTLAGGECAECNKKKRLGLQTKLKVNEPGDSYEQEADRIADQVMAAPTHPDIWSAPPRILRLPTGRAGQTHTAPASVDGALASASTPLEPALRREMEQRFGHDFSRVRVHSGAAAEQSARDVNAHAYTVGHDIVFGADRFAPRTHEGRRLLAHELTHVAQQAGATDAGLQRACLPASKCETHEGSAVQVSKDLEQTEAPEREKTKQLTPQQARSEHHGDRAVEFEKLFQAELPTLRPLIHGIFIDPNADPRVGARIIGCMNWAQMALPPGTTVPEFQGAKHRCVFISPQLEKEAGTYNNNKALETIGGRPRMDWRIDILGRLTHEVTHERFLEAKLPFPTQQTEDANCKPGNYKLNREISELAAEISEFPIHRQATDPNGPQGINTWFRVNLTKPGENIPGTIREIRCRCACADADSLIRAAFELAASSWPEEEKTAFHVQMERGIGADYDVYWPFELPPRVGRVGRNELSFGLGIGFTGSDRLYVAMLTYRHVLSQWAAGRFRLTGGIQGNLLSPLAPQLGFSPRGEFGAGIIGVNLIPTTESVEKKFGGFTARVDTGLGIGEFSLKPESPGSTATTGVRADYILQVGGGIQFFIPGLTSLTPASLEAAYRLTQPFDADAKRIHTIGLTFGIPF